MTMARWEVQPEASGFSPPILAQADNNFYSDYCFSKSMLSYSWRAMAARICAGVFPSLICW